MKKFYLRTGVRFLVFVGATLICCFAGDRYFPAREFEFWGLIAFALLVLIPQGMLFPVIRSLGYKHDASPCLKHSNQCCVELFKDKLANKFGSNIAIDDATMEKYSLTRFDKMEELVSKFASDDPVILKASFKELIKDDNDDPNLTGVKREIWFFSYEISADSFMGRIQNMPIIKGNSQDIEFVYFYIWGDNAAEREMDEIMQLNPNAKFIWKQITLGQTTDFSTINVLPQLLGSVVFIFHAKGVSKTITSFASFFALKGKMQDSIYFRMPYCMNEDYYNYFRGLKVGDTP